jgi:hypothetical protein
VDARGPGQISWLPVTAQVDTVTNQDVESAFDEEGQGELIDPISFGENTGELALINKILNHQDFRALAAQVPGAKASFEGLAETLRKQEVAADSPEVIAAFDEIGNLSPVFFDERHFNEFFSSLSETHEDEGVMLAQEQALHTVNDEAKFEALMAQFRELYTNMTSQMVRSRVPMGYQASSKTTLVVAQGVSTPLSTPSYKSIGDLEDDLATMGPYPETYNRILSQVDDEDQDDAKAALTAFFQGLPGGLCTLYGILAKAGLAEPIDYDIIDKITEMHPQVANEEEGQMDEKRASREDGLFLPKSGEKGKLKKEASGGIGGKSPAYYTHGPGENRYCPKLRGVVNTSICRYHCLDGLPVDDHQILCGEAVWRGNVMDKYSREYRDADGNWVGGYINKRFEVERSVGRNPYQLKPGTRSAPINEDAWSTEKRLQELRREEGESRRFSPTPGDPEGLYAFDPYEAAGTTQNPQVFEKTKDPISKLASKKKKKWDPNPWAVCHETVDKDEDPDKYERCVLKVKKKQSSSEQEFSTSDSMFEEKSAQYMMEEQDIRAGKDCMDCGWHTGNDDVICPKCGGHNLRTKTKIEHAVDTKSVAKPDLMMANGVWRATYGDAVAYGKDPAEAQSKLTDKVRGLAELGPGTVEEEAGELSNIMQGDPGTEAWTPAPAPAAGVRDPLVDMTPTTEEVPAPPSPPSVEIQGGVSEFEPQQAHVDASELDTILADEATGATLDEQEEIDDKARSLALGPDTRS